MFVRQTRMEGEQKRVRVGEKLSAAGPAVLPVQFPNGGLTCWPAAEQ